MSVITNHNSTGYRNGCRCELCRAAMTSYMRGYKRDKREERRAYLRAYKERPCADCGVQYPWYVMQFDHVRGAASKDYNISDRKVLAKSWPSILREIAKCEVVCANCHYERTYQAGYYNPGARIPTLGINALLRDGLV